MSRHRLAPAHRPPLLRPPMLPLRLLRRPSAKPSVTTVRNDSTGKQAVPPLCRRPPRQRSCNLGRRQSRGSGNDTPTPAAAAEPAPNNAAAGSSRSAPCPTRTEARQRLETREAKPRTCLARPTPSLNVRKRATRCFTAPVLPASRKIRRKPPASTSSAATFRACC